MSHFSYSLKSSEVTSRACLFTPHLPGTLSSSPRLPPNPGRSQEKEGQRQAQRGVSFIGPPRRSPSLVSSGSAPLTSPRNSLLVSVCNAGIGRKRPRDIPCVAAIWCLSPPPAVTPTHKFTHSWSRASSMLWELKPNGRLITPPQGHAGVCEQEPNVVCRKHAGECPRGSTQVHSTRAFCERF